MESFLTFSPKFSQLQSHKWSAIPRPAISETLIPPKKMFPSISSAHTHCYPPPQLCCCNTSSSSSLDYNTDSSTKIFIKVKLIMDRESGQSLGVAYIWFSRKESALLAVKEMNGKFFDGRFIYVTVAKPRSYKNWRTMAPYRF
ncbi:Glycine-rich RNA-binding protein like [Quillaja saponaria]|uniref:Glycine-rich RNA-binding protein like n=1 Tax=Quillaja saponaria TaxID=32244 RepID=A0AAD7LBA7_QUISA|nr:Glycine-rich RNA-binding protein like [Quillaja saponaria]